MMESNPDMFSKLSATSHEEHIWLLQQQYPERILKHFSAWQLDADIDVPMLTLAIKSVIETMPDLNARYQFNDESCDVCLVVEGSPCTKREWEGRKPGKWVTYREETHKTTALNRGLSWPMNEHEAQSARLRMPRNKNR